MRMMKKGGGCRRRGCDDGEREREVFAVPVWWSPELREGEMRIDEDDEEGRRLPPPRL
ncbi:hypothetical protein LINGRAPRIM_LOCUS2597 [Linum grandiflorum]